MKKIDITEALISLAPGVLWTIDGEPIYKNLKWLDPDYPKPTESQVLNETARLQAEYDAKEYQRQRAKEYPPLADQLDMQYHDALNGTTTWQDAITAVKTKYPKLEES
jgi:hypothetical protein